MTTFPLERSNLKNYKYTENAFLPKIAIIPLVQGDGSVCKSLVKAGDIVEEGDVIGIPMTGAGKSSKIHAPIPGKIIDIVSVMNYDGKILPAVQIKLEGKFTYLGKKLSENKWEDSSSDFLISQLLDSGIINTFICSKPECLGYQLDSILNNNQEGNNSKKEKCIIVRLFDEDPSRLTDSLISNFYFEKIRIASKVLANILGTKNILYLINNSNENSELIKKLEDICNIVPEKNNDTKKFFQKKSDKNNTDNLSSDSKEEGFSETSASQNDYNEDYVFENITKYPFGTKREILSSVNKLFRKNIKFKITKDDLFIDSSSLLEVYNSIVLGIPSMEKYVHISGDCLYSSCLLQVKIGTTLKDIVNQLGGFNKTPKQILINGLVCGSEVSDLNVPVTKNVKSISFRSKYNFCDVNVYPCIKCGNCRTICPVKISPDILCNSIELGLELSEKESKSTLLCTDCGLCNTVCPSRLPISQMISILKNDRSEK